MLHLEEESDFTDVSNGAIVQGCQHSIAAHYWGYTSLDVIGVKCQWGLPQDLQPFVTLLWMCRTSFSCSSPCPPALSSTNVSSQLMGWWFPMHAPPGNFSTTPLSQTSRCSASQLLHHPSLTDIPVCLQSSFGLSIVNLAAAAIYG